MARDGRIRAGEARSAETQGLLARRKVWRALMPIMLGTLAACSRPDELVSRRPLLTPGHTIDAPRFKTGVWRFVWPNYEDNPCPFDPSQPIAAWPACDAPEGVSTHTMAPLRSATSPLSPRLSEPGAPYVLVGGQTPVLQRFGAVYPGRYSYDAVDQIRLDAAGRIVAARLTPITCFDPTDFAAAMAWQSNAVTEDNTHPIEPPSSGEAHPALKPGFSRDAKGDCRPRDLQALLDAAAADAAASKEGVNFAWVRDRAG